jgi:hypothetical protein
VVDSHPTGPAPSAARLGLVALTALLAIPGCFEDISIDPRDLDGGQQDTGGDADTDTDADGDADTDTDGDADTDTDSETGTGTAPPSCNGLDVVIAVDAAAATHLRDALRTRLLSALPELQAIGGGAVEIRVAVIDGCPSPAAFHDWSAGGSCDLPGGVNWTSSASGSFFGDLECLLNLAVGGGYQGTLDTCAAGAEAAQPAWTAVSALSHASNDGFLREDALLLILTLTDTDESFHSASAEAVFQGAVAAKGAGRVAFVGFGGEPEIIIVDPDCDSAYDLPSLEYDVQNSANLRQIALGFGADGLFSSLCHNGPNGSSDPIAAALSSITGRLGSLCEAF